MKAARVPPASKREGLTMRRAGWMIAGLVLGSVLVFGLGMALPSVIAISQAEGAYAMGVAFFWTPLGAVLGALAGFVLSARRR